MKTIFLTVHLSLVLMSSLCFAESKFNARERLMVIDSYEAPAGRLFNEEAYLSQNSVLNEYVNIIVINKSAKGEGAQTLRFYRNRQLRLVTKVSTGREDLEYVGTLTGFFRKFSKGSTASHWRHTTAGFYTIKRIEDADYRSGESRFRMPYAMFFNDKRGLAIHQVPPDLSGGEAAGESLLGRRASGGCVRVHKRDIQLIHDLVIDGSKGSVPVIDTRTGEALKDENGQILYQEQYRTLVIVEEA